MTHLPGDAEVEAAQAFVPIKIHASVVHVLDRARTSSVRVFRAEDGFEVRLPEILIEHMLAMGRRAEPLEWYALLVGRSCVDAEGRHVVVDAVVLDDEATAYEGYIATTIESERRQRELAAQFFPASDAVGWTHGHVRCGAVFSARDHENQETWTDPDTIGMVVDPWDKTQIAVYRGPRSERLSEVITTEHPVVHGNRGAGGHGTSGRHRAPGFFGLGIARAILTVALGLAGVIPLVGIGLHTRALATRVTALESRRTHEPGRLAPQHAHDVARTPPHVDITAHSALRESTDPGLKGVNKDGLADSFSQRPERSIPAPQPRPSRSSTGRRARPHTTLPVNSPGPNERVRPEHSGIASGGQPATPSTNGT